MSNEKMHRKSFRILGTVQLVYEVIDDRTFERGIGHWKLRSGAGTGFRSTLLDVDARFREKLLILQTESPTLAAALKLLNTKIDAMMEQLPDVRNSKMILAKQDPQTCEISADGMLFAADREYPEGTKMALRFLLAADSRYVETFCRVVRMTQPPDDSDSALIYGVAVEFCGMQSAQKDIIVQHLFDRESETLRMRRLEIDTNS
jgi:hypothetical protein